MGYQQKYHNKELTYLHIK